MAEMLNPKNAAASTPAASTKSPLAWLAQKLSFRSTPHDLSLQASRGLNIIGPLYSENETARLARAAIRAAESFHLPCAAISIDAAPHPEKSSKPSPYRSENPYHANLFYLSPQDAGKIDSVLAPDFCTQRHNIAYWDCATKHFPAALVAAAETFQEIWVPAHFAYNALSEKLQKPVHIVPPCIEFSRPAGALRERFGLPDRQFLFLINADLSAPDRCNTAAALEAFRSAFKSRSDAGCVLLVSNQEAHAAAYENLLEATLATPNTVLLTYSQIRSDVHALQAACDAYLSLHRTEGLALLLAECMFLGKPVISTDAAGPANYIDATNACPVSAHFDQATETFEPDLENAAHWMRRLVDEPEFGRRLGWYARATIELHFSAEKSAQHMNRRLISIATHARATTATQ